MCLEQERRCCSLCRHLSKSHHVPPAHTRIHSLLREQSLYLFGAEGPYYGSCRPFCHPSGSECLHLLAILHRIPLEALLSSYFSPQIPSSFFGSISSTRSRHTCKRNTDSRGDTDRSQLLWTKKMPNQVFSCKIAAQPLVAGAGLISPWRDYSIAITWPLLAWAKGRSRSASPG